MTIEATPPCPPTPCREWQGTKDQGGYGTKQVSHLGRRRPMLVHRWVYSRLHGGFRGIHGREVMHLCDNPACFRYDHLWLGTHADNMRDMVTKGRARGGGCPPSRYGEASNLAKLTEVEVKQILDASALGETQCSIARRFNIAQSTVSGIVHRKSWSTVQWP